jgi:dynamin 1-like protein
MSLHAWCVPCSISDYKNELKKLGNDVTGNRGKMLHLILTLCQKVEKAFNKIVDGGEGGV